MGHQEYLVHFGGALDVWNQSSEPLSFCIRVIEELPLLLRTFLQYRNLLLKLLVALHPNSPPGTPRGFERPMTVSGLSQEVSVRFLRSWSSGEVEFGLAASVVASGFDGLILSFCQ
jgi:hypothetical protein